MNTSTVKQGIGRGDSGSEWTVIWYAILIWLARKLSSRPGSADVDCLRDNPGAGLLHSAHSLPSPLGSSPVAVVVSWQ